MQLTRTTDHWMNTWVTFTTPSFVNKSVYTENVQRTMDE